MQANNWKIIHGAFAPPLSPVPGTIGGKATGVGVLTNCPGRPLVNDWATTEWATGRIQASAIFVQENWVKVGVFYGYAKDAHTKATKDRTDELLANLTQRVVMASNGYRVIMGDFNCLPHDLPQFAIWRAHGFQELQELAWQRWNQPVRPTCKGKSVKDHVWVSPELALKLQSVHTDDTFSADHAVVYGSFADLGRPEPVPIWTKPKPIPWEGIDKLSLQKQVVPSNLDSYAKIFGALEDVAHAALSSQTETGLVQPSEEELPQSCPSGRERQSHPFDRLGPMKCRCSSKGKIFSIRNGADNSAASRAFRHSQHAHLTRRPVSDIGINFGLQLEVPRAFQEVFRQCGTHVPPNKRASQKFSLANRLMQMLPEQSSEASIVSSKFSRRP